MTIAMAIRQLLATHAEDTWGQMTRQDLIAEAAGEYRVDPDLFADACLALGIGDGEPSQTVVINVHYLD